jgi:hypothetical protein
MFRLNLKSLILYLILVNNNNNTTNNNIINNNIINNNITNSIINIIMAIYNWLYNSSNENIYILFLIIIILVLIILNFGLWKRKNDRFNDITTSTAYQAPTETNPAFNLGLTEEEKQKFYTGLSQIDGDQETIFRKTVGNDETRQNDILNQASNLYTSTLTGNGSVISSAYSGVGNYATLDDIGSSITDTLGGIQSSLGYTIIDNQLGIFTPKLKTNEFEYDNTADYNTGLDSRTVNGVSNNGGCNGTPIFLQKDFTGVANIFAPNIIVANPPLYSDGTPNINFRM